MVNVADDNGEQADKQYDSSGVDDRVQGLDAWREILHTAEVLRDRWGDKFSVLKYYCHFTSLHVITQELSCL